MMDAYFLSDGRMNEENNVQTINRCPVRTIRCSWI